MDLRLENHLAVITGGASGIGLATARLFAQETCRVALWDAHSDVQKIAAQLQQETGASILGVPVDVSQRSSVAAALEQTLASAGTIDHFVHAAAIGSGKFGFPFTNVDPDDWRRILEINVMGMTYVAHAVAPEMIGRRQGTMVFISSVAGQIGSQTDPPYSASKAANINFSQCLAKDLAPHGVRVNTVCPGMVQTPLNRSVWQAWHDQQPPEQRKSYEEWAGDKVRQVVPLGRWQQPSDIAEMIVFLSSERAAQVTGQTINVDGGFVMHW
ncbi:MAG: SDR family oxidoreductase [Planctomycetaceae bacterium]